MLLLQLQIHETFGAKYCTGRMWFCFYSDAALLFSTPDTKRSLKFISVSHNPNVEKRCTLWNGFHFYPAKNIRSDKAATKQFTVIKLFCITRAVNVNVLSWNNVEVSRVIVSGDIRLMNCRLAPCAQSQKVYRMSNFGSRRRSKKKKGNMLDECTFSSLPGLCLASFCRLEVVLHSSRVCSPPELLSPAAICLKNAYITFCENSFLQGLH